MGGGRRGHVRTVFWCQARPYLFGRYATCRRIPKCGVQQVVRWARRVHAHDRAPIQKMLEHAPAVEEVACPELPLWREVLAGIDWLRLRASRANFGLGVPPGDVAAVITIPGFLGSDVYLCELHAWLERIGYRAYRSGMPRPRGERGTARGPSGRSVPLAVLEGTRSAPAPCP